jgi:hypothetical protein
MESRIDQLLKLARQLGSGQVPAYQYNECYTSGAFDLLVVYSRGSEAFALLEELCARFPSEHASGCDLKATTSCFRK